VNGDIAALLDPNFSDVKRRRAIVFEASKQVGVLSQ
jgi:hypothetical protein